MTIYALHGFGAILFWFFIFCIISYKINETFRNYITVLVRKIWGLIESDIRLLSVEDHYVSDSVLADIAFSELDGRVVFYEH